MAIRGLLMEKKNFITEKINDFLCLIAFLSFPTPPFPHPFHAQNGKYFIENPPDKDKLIQVEVMDTIVIATEENKNPLRLVFCDVDVASTISQPQAFSDIFEGRGCMKCHWVE